MKKKQVKKKAAVKKHTRKKIQTKKKRISLHGPLLILLLALGFYLFNLHQTIPSGLSKKTVAALEPLISPTAIPVVTPTPTPIPVPAGFCLNVPVLFYHHVQPQTDAVTKAQTSLSVDNKIFDEQMAYVVSSGYHAINAEQLVQALRSHTSLGKAIVITFDDGYKDSAVYADPILQKYGLQGNLMLATGLVGGADYLDWGQVGQLKSHGWYFTDHTWSHYAVNTGSVDKIQYEIQTARQQIQDHTGQNIDVFTYPYGSFNDLSISLLQQDGFIGAYSTIGGTYQCDSFIMTLHRTRIGNTNFSSYGI